MVEDLFDPQDPKVIWARVRKISLFARSVLHLPFPELEVVNPSFAVLSKYCELIAVLLKDQKTNPENHERAAELACVLQDIATAIIDRDDKAIIDLMSSLDQFLDDTRHLHR